VDPDSARKQKTEKGRSGHQKDGKKKFSSDWGHTQAPRSTRKARLILDPQNETTSKTLKRQENLKSQERFYIGHQRRSRSKTYLGEKKSCTKTILRKGNSDTDHIQRKAHHRRPRCIVHAQREAAFTGVHEKKIRQAFKGGSKAQSDATLVGVAHSRRQRPDRERRHYEVKKGLHAEMVARGRGEQ